MNERDVLQTVRLKGRVSAADLADALGADPNSIVDRLVADGALLDTPALRLTPTGRERLAELLAAERATVDRAAAEAVYERFTPVNADFKSALSQWQLARAGGAADPAGDASVLASVQDVHQRVTPVIVAAAELLPRLSRYSDRLAAALRLAAAGDLAWLSRPLVDSYHTVWFELHEELIGLAGRTRKD
ncbi:hypothetical protein MARA_37200 [Mycolicibacterium arabiense]|uniref:Uncharacterized protein n=1 Tax=Mycolicibacterium arabiense TaxID=1286181 RepID=A0A7I7S066_9MYCO|nr:MarR family transcriptional regulator [Mycolicibacterium arabiense]MCV7371547.1 MarR family transcriptional regulator [Mycolicibacterium arabiense]BBY50252.1 hypothetical protein MARA_37200 [Mycolicibacterium arabiense]